MRNPCAPRPRWWRRSAGHARGVAHIAPPCPAPVKGSIAKALMLGLLGTGALASGAAAGVAWTALSPPAAPAIGVLPELGAAPAAFDRVWRPDDCRDDCGDDGHRHRRPPQDVPEPMSLIIFGEALVGLAAARCLTRTW